MKQIVMRVVLASLLFVSVAAHFTDLLVIPGLKLPQLNELNTMVLKIETFNDFLFANLYVGLFYYLLYLGVGSALESSNPAPKTEYRKMMTKKEIALGLQAIFWIILTSVSWIWLVEPNGPYYGYYNTHDFTIMDFIKSVVVYMVLFDCWFFVTHMTLHHPICWRWFHRLHHQFPEPTAFGQDAVHPFEAVLQGPCGHFAVSLFFPFHPVCHALFGFLTGLYAIFAHDGRWDYNRHNQHHFYSSCNYGLFGLMDTLWQTKYNKADFPADYVPMWVQRPEKQIVG